MNRSRTVLAVILFACVFQLATPAWSYWAVHFADAQAKAGAIVLVRAQAAVDQPLHLTVLRTMVGRVASNDLVVNHPGWLNGSKIVDQHVYIVLLTADNEPYRGELTSDGIPLFSCGLINTLEVVDDLVQDSDLYDVKYMKTRKPVPLADVEREIRQTHGIKDGV
jgi:hypothetical protein